MVSKFEIGLCCCIFFSSFLAYQPVHSQETGQRSHTRASATLSGTVTDASTGKPLEGASLYFSDIRAGAVSKKDGRYRFQNIPEGKHLLEISFVGYAAQSVMIDLKGSYVRDVALQPAIVENEGVTVTGVASAISLRKSPVPVHILRKVDLLKTPATNLIDALSHTPGVSQISTGPAISKPTIRGLGYNRLVVISDGIRQEGQQWGDEHGIEIDELSVVKAEVLKGPASIMYGSDALAGVINLISNIPVADSTIEGNVLATYQTNNALSGIHTNIAGNLNGLNWNAYATARSARDYRNRFDGRVFNSRFGEFSYGVNAGLNKSWGYSHFLFSVFNQQPGLVEGERDLLSGKFLKQVNVAGTAELLPTDDVDYDSRAAQIPKQEIKHIKFSIDNSLNIGRDRLTFILGYQENLRMEYGDVVQPEERELFFDLGTFNYNVQYHFAEKNNWRTSIGVNGLYQLNRNKGLEAMIPDYHLSDIGAFLFTRKSVGQFTYSGGVRVDNRQIHARDYMDQGQLKFPSFSKSFTNFSGSAGLSYEASKNLTLKLNLARGFRSPSLPELSSNGAHEGTNRHEYGDRNLKSETSLQADLGVEVNSQHVSFSGSFFLNRINDFIFYRKLASMSGSDSLVTENGEHHLAFRFDQGNAYLYGAEFNLDLHPHPLDWLHIENTFTYVRGKLNELRDGSSNLPFIPAARLVNQVRADVSRKGNAFRNIYISAELDNTFAQLHPFTGYNTETTTPGYSLLNIGAGTDVLSGGKTIFSIYLAANNMTDKAYQNHLSRLKYTDFNGRTGRTGIYNMGRNFSIKLNVPFSFSSSGRRDKTSGKAR